MQSHTIVNQVVLRLSLNPIMSVNNLAFSKLIYFAFFTELSIELCLAIWGLALIVLNPHFLPLLTLSFRPMSINHESRSVCGSAE